VSRNHEARSSKRQGWQYPQIFVYQQTKSTQLATKLLLSYSHLVASAAHKLTRNHLNLYDDLYQVGQLSLLLSLERYDHKYGSTFESYAWKSMMGSMMDYLGDKASIIPMPGWLKEKWTLIQLAIDDLTMKQAKSPSISEIADYTNLTEYVIRKVLAGQAFFHVASLDAPLSNGQGELTLMDVIGKDVEEYQDVEFRLDMNRAWSQLNDIEKRILHLNLVEGESQRIIAYRLKISQITVSRTLKQALEKMKKGLFHSTSSKIE
jgi:RNA polymerase sigma-B factor